MPIQFEADGNCRWIEDTVNGNPHKSIMVNQVRVLNLLSKGRAGSGDDMNGVFHLFACGGCMPLPYWLVTGYANQQGK